MSKQHYDNLQSRISSAQSELNNIRNQISSINSSTSYSQSLINSTQNQMSQLQIEQSSIINNESSLSAQNNSLSSTLNSLRQREIDLSAELSNLMSQSQSLQQNLSSAQNSSIMATNLLNQEIAHNQSLALKKQENTSILANFRSLLTNFAPITGMKLNTTTLITEKASSDSLMHSTLTKDTIIKQSKEDFDKLFDKIDDINFQDAEGKTILIHSSINGFLHGIDKCLDAGANVDLLDKSNSNALIYFASIPQSKYLKKMVDKSSCEKDVLNYVVELNEKNSVGIMHSLINNTNNVIWTEEFAEEDGQVHLYFEGNCIIGELNISNNTVIHAGGTEGRSSYQDKVLDLIKYLRDKGANTDVQNKQGMTPFFLVCAKKFKYLANKMLDELMINVELVDANKQNALMWALETRDKSLMKKIIDKGIDINAQDINAFTCLYWATRYQWSDMVDFLIQNGANPDITDKAGYGPIHLSAQINNIDLLKALATKVSDINIKSNNKFEMTALHLASKFGAIDAVRYLIQNGANKFATCKDVMLNGDHNEGYSPLHLAAFTNKLNIVKCLIEEFGVKINPDIASSAEPFYLSVFQGSEELIRYMLDRGAEVNKPSFDGDTPLHGVCYVGKIGVMRILKEFGANSGAKNMDGKIPLHCMIESGGIEKQNKIEAIKAYKNLFGIDLAATDNNGISIEADLHNVFNEHEYESIVLGVSTS
jgi:ankyrin repeat protein